MGNVNLLGDNTSLFCPRLKWALKLEGVEYEFIKEDITNKSPLSLKYNPVHKKISVLVHDENSVTESRVILEHERRGTHCYLKIHMRETRSGSGLNSNDEKIAPAVFVASNLQGEEKEKTVQAAQELLALLEKQIEGKGFFGGDR